MGGGSKSTTTTTVTQTAEEKEFTRQQIELAKQQLKLTEEQHGWQSEIFALTKPMLQKYGLMFDQQYDEYMAPSAATLREKYRTLESAQVDSAIRNQPIQDELLQLQLDEIRRGGRATDEQKRLIAEITQRGIDAGQSDIGNFLERGLGTIRKELAPSRGMRPDDAPIIDEGEQLALEAIRQQGQLVSGARGAQAAAELNFPLNASQVYGAQAQFQQGFQSSMSQYLQGLRQQAVANRNQFQTQAFQGPVAAGEQGIGLINASRPTPVSFPRNTTETTKTSGGGSIFGAVGGLLSGIGSVGSLFSTEKAKTNIKPLADGQHLLSPGALKRNITPIGNERAPGHERPESAMHPTFNMELDSLLGNRPQGFDPYMAAGNRLGFDEVRDPIFTGAPPAPKAKTDEAMLQSIAKLPVSTWQYKPETGMGNETHVGPMAEDFNTKIMNKGPKPLISTVDAIGSLMSSVKALEARTRASQNRPQHTKFGTGPAGYRGRRQPVGSWRKAS